MDLRLDNKVIVVTGSTGGPGLDIIRTLIDEGAILAIIRKNIDDDFRFALEGRSANENLIMIRAELMDATECKNAIQMIIQKFGRIDGLINNPDFYEDLEQDGYDFFLENLQNNLVNYYLVTHFALPYLIKSRGTILNVSAGRKSAGHETADLAAAVGGVNALTREWAVELLKYGIRVNNIVVTGPDAEIADSVAFFLSEKSSHTTGQLIRVSNEYVLK
jgi:L-fucose dehydrogenase